MIKSMTGYSYREFIYNNRKFVINIKSLNSRFLDIKINLPKEISNAESEIQNIISENIQRGKIEFEIFIENMNNNDLLKIDYSILEEYFNLISDICDRYKIQKNITLGDIINLINSLKSKKSNNNIYDKFIKEEIIEAINLLNKMREKEGKIIYKKILPILSEIKSNLKKIEKRMPNIIKEYENDDTIFITVAGRSNALSGFADANTKRPVIACPNITDKNLLLIDLFSTLRMPSAVSPMLILEPENAALAALKILALKDKNLESKINNFQIKQKNQIENDDKEILKN